MKPTVCLAMIVKDEAHIIQRCLDSVKDEFTDIIIHDTGSTDDTLKIVERWIKANDKHGFITSVEWKDFGHNRSEILQAARYCADYTLMLDADETLEGSLKQHIDKHGPHDTYQLQVNLANISYRRNFLFRNTAQWRFEGVVHEHPVCEDKDFTTGYIEPNVARIISHHDGARSKDADKYRKDAELLASVKDPSPRDVFYLAQSLRDAGKTDAAYQKYVERTYMGGWFQELAYSYYMLAKIDSNVHHFLDAYELDPRRAEPLLALGKRYMDDKQWHTALLYLREAHDKRPHDDMLFREDDVYNWRSTMELAVCLHYCGEYEEAEGLNDWLLLFNHEIPQHIRTQVEKNLRFARDALNKHEI